MLGIGQLTGMTRLRARRHRVRCGIGGREMAIIGLNQR